MSGAQGGEVQQEGGGVGESRGGRARHPWGGVAELFRADGGTPNAAPAVPRKPQAGDLGEKVGGSTTMG